MLGVFRILPSVAFFVNFFNPELCKCLNIAGKQKQQNICFYTNPSKVINES